MGATGQIGSRTDPPHCTPRHRVGEDGARDWPQLSKPESRSRIADRLSPCCIGGLPGISARTHLVGVVKTRGLNPSLQSAWSQYMGCWKARKCRCFFGLAHLGVHRQWRLTLAPAGHCGDRPHNVECVSTSCPPPPLAKRGLTYEEAGGESKAADRIAQAGKPVRRPCFHGISPTIRRPNLELSVTPNELGAQRGELAMETRSDVGQGVETLGFA
jgi:hypothetical protein